MNQLQKRDPKIDGLTNSENEWPLDPWYYFTPSEEETFWLEEELYPATWSKENCKEEFREVLHQIRRSWRDEEISDRFLGLLYSSVMARYLGCLFEADFQEKIDKWSHKLFGFSGF